MLSIKNKIIFSIVSLIVVFGSIATFTVFSMTKNNLIKMEQEDVNQHNRTHSSAAQQVLVFSKDLVKGVALDKDVVSLLNDISSKDTAYNEETIDHVTNHYLKAINIGDMYSAIYVMNIDGVTIASTAESFLGKNYSFRDYFINAMNGDSYSDVSVGITSKELGYYFSHPVKSNVGNVIGVVVAKMRPEVLSKPFANFDSSDVNIMLVDSYGVIIFSKDESRYLHSLGEFSKNDREKFINDKRYGEIRINGTGKMEIQEKLGVIGKEQKVFELQDKDGNWEYIAVSKIPDFPFYVITETKIDSLIEIAIRTSMIIAIFVLVAALVVAVFVAVLVARLMSPLSKLQKAVEKVSMGDLSERIDVKSQDEVGFLALSFNKMIDSIVEERASVDKKVEEQTKNLIIQQVESDKVRETAEKVAVAMTGRELKMIELKEEIKRFKKEKGVH